MEFDLRGFQQFEGEFPGLPVGTERFLDAPGERHVVL